MAPKTLTKAAATAAAAQTTGHKEEEERCLGGPALPSEAVLISVSGVSV